MKYMYRFCTICFFGFLLGACTKEETSLPIQPQEPNDEAFLQNLPNDVLFHFQYRSDPQAEVQGWFIDKSGQLKSYTSPNLLQGTSVSRQQMENLYAKASQTYLTIPTSELVPRVKTMQLLSHTTLDTPILDESRQDQILIQAYRQIDMAWKPNTCSERPSSGAHDALVDKFEVVLLKAEGYFNQQNTHFNAHELLDWLLLMQKRAGL